MKKIFIVVLLATFLNSILFSHAGAEFKNISINQNVKYYGYDWLDGRNMSVESALNNISATGPTKTNMNIVHTIENLNSPVCENNKCALSIGAGTSYPNSWLDICPLSKNSEECVNNGSWYNIWKIAEDIKSAQNIPVAIYFIDEPSFQPGLRDSNNRYVTWQYAAYLCTLRLALREQGLDIKIFTITALFELGPDSTPYNITNELRHQIPFQGCASVKSTPDWIGIDNYDWKHVVGVTDDTAIIHSTYNKYFPNVKWVLVPPSTKDLGYNDQELRDRIQVYWDYLWIYPNDPVIAIMNFRFDNKVMNQNKDNPENDYLQSRELLKFMGNVLTP